VPIAPTLCRESWLSCNRSRCPRTNAIRTRIQTMVLKLTLHLSEPGRGSIASAGGSGAIVFGVATTATAAQTAELRSSV